MKEYYFTIGQRFRHEQHPLGLHPDGYLVIEASDENKARERMFQLCGDAWAMVYDDKSYVNPRYFPRGELHREIYE